MLDAWCVAYNELITFLGNANRKTISNDLEIMRFNNVSFFRHTSHIYTSCVCVCIYYSLKKFDKMFFSVCMRACGRHNVNKNLQIDTQKRFHHSESGKLFSTVAAMGRVYFVLKCFPVRFFFSSSSSSSFTYVTKLAIWLYVLH